MPETTRPVFDVGGKRRLALVVLGYVPLLHVAGVVGVAAAPWLFGASRGGWVLALALLYLLPPFAVRVAARILPQQHGRLSLDSREMLTWWFAAQWQVVFNRLPMLEELLRLVPGVYSAWLRLWGARVGGQVYWSPGCRILDRQLARVGRRVIIGAGVRLSPHLVTRGEDGAPELWLAPITVGDGALVGAHGLLGPGVHILAGEMTPALQPLPPFTEWREGRRHPRHVSIAG